jgi:hypothetical protein
MLLPMKCPHCLVDFHDEQMLWSVSLGDDVDGTWFVERRTCPACKRFVATLKNGRRRTGVNPGGQGTQNVHLQLGDGQLIGPRSLMVWPKGVSRSPVPVEVPPGIAEDYKEACLVLSDSPKASAALSRRCLQAILRDKAGTTSRDLNDQIDEVINAAKVPGHISEGLHAVRMIGNFAAHTMKSTTTGAILDVEPGEAEWNLEILESLFDFYFVLPALAAKRKAELNKKLKDAGKPEIV